MAVFDPRTELLIDGVWTDVSAYVQYEAGVTVTRGRDDEQAQITPSRCALTLNNRDGRFSNRNPMSPYYGLLGRNTQLRQSMAGFPTHLALNGLFGGYAWAADSAGLDITGDIDIRIDLEPQTWTPATDQVIASKTSTTGNNRSWYLLLKTTGAIEFGWSAAGTFPYESVTSSVVPATGRLTIRVTLDVVNGANHTTTFYTGDSVTTATTQLGAATNTAGATSIYAGNAPLEVGSANTGQVVLTGNTRLVGKLYRLQVYSGIAGTIRADPDFTAQEAGTTSFSDGIQTWTVNAPDRITNDGIRFHGEVPSWPVKWDLSGKAVWTPIEASGITRRLTQGASPLRSAIYRNLSQYNPAGYWPLEDGAESETAASAVTNGVPASVTAVTFAGDDTLPGGATAVTLDDTTSRINGSVRRTIGGTGWSFMLFFKLPALPGADTKLISWTASGTLTRWELLISATSYKMNAYDSSDTAIITQSSLFGAGAAPNQWIAMQVETELSAGTVTWAQIWHAVGSGTFYAATSTYSGTAGSVRAFSVVGQVYLTGASMAHIYTGENTLPFVDDGFARASNGYRGESAVARIRRLCGEEGVPVVITAATTNDGSASMGRQSVATFMDLLNECADADIGILYEPRDVLALGYITRTVLYNQTGPAFDYTAGHIAEPFEPTDDDQALRNDVTVTRPGGSSARYVLEAGPLSVQAPPAGVGRYDDAVDVNVYADTQLLDIAAWLVHLGTFDDLRYPQVSFKLANSAYTGSPAMTGQVAELDLGRVYTITNLPAWLPPDPTRQMIQGYTETATPYEWDLTANNSPGALWDVAVEGVARADTTASELDADATSTATSLLVATTDGPVWTTDPAEFPFDCKVGGERVTVTAISGTTSPQTFTVTRSVNSVVKAQTNGTAISLAEPAYAAL